MAGKVHYRNLHGMIANGIALIDAVRVPSENSENLVTLYFRADAPMDRIGLPRGTEVLSQVTIGGCPIIKLRLPEGEPLRIGFGGAVADITPADPELSIFAGTNALAATRNGETAATVLRWLEFNAEHQGVETAVILDRDRLGDSLEFDEAFQAGLAAMEADVEVVILRSPTPLGKLDLPDESHPFCAPGAPGKDRMEIPAADPWKSPLGAMHAYEIIRERFLGSARAVANVDVFDLITDTGEGTIFDRAVASDTGAIPMLGTQAYPWRVRNDEPIRFADHICVQFDAEAPRRRWCIAPAKAAANAVWRMNRIGNVAMQDADAATFYRFMNLRHRADAVSLIIPKSSLVEDDRLLALAEAEFDHKPVRVPEKSHKAQEPQKGRRAIVTTMKNEGPFILEWLAYHRVIGFDSFLVYTNDCSDGTETFFDLLQEKGYVQHRDNPFRESGLKPQHAALAAAGNEPIITEATWAVCIDVDEFVDIKVGDRTLDALFAAVPDANLISMTWRLFGNGGQSSFTDAPVTERFTTAATRTIPVPLGHFFKTIYRRSVFGEMGVHRPKSLANGTARWADAAGQPLPDAIAQAPNRINSFGHVPAKPLVQLNHYSVRSVAEYVLKTRRGLPNKMLLDLGLKYWVSRNWNTVEDRAISHHAPATRAMRAEIETDALRDLHQKAVAWHQERFAQTMTDPDMVDLYWQLQLAGSSHEPDADTARSYFAFLQAVHWQEGA